MVDGGRWTVDGGRWTVTSAVGSQSDKPSLHDHQSHTPATMSEKSSCLCFDLRSGSLAIGITLAVVGGLITVSSLIYIGELQQDRDYEGFHRYQNYDELKIMLLCQAVIGILFLIFNSLLIHGVRKRKTGMVLAWLIYHGVYSSIKTVALMIGLAFAMASGKRSQKVGVAVGFLETILFWRLLLFVFRYHTSLKQQMGESHMPQKDEDVENMTKVQV